MISNNPHPFNDGYLPEQDGHQVWFAQYGNPAGVPVIVCHGGPGSKSKPKHIYRYDLNKYHVIIFDQRGCGKSLPLGEIKFNTTTSLVSDMERLRVLLKFDKWYVAGGSWGSTLSLVYAESYPTRVLGLLLSSIFLGRRKDLDWSFTNVGGIDKIFSDLWDSRNRFLSKHDANYSNAAKVLLNKLDASSPDVVSEIVVGVMDWEDNLMSSQSDLTFTNPKDVTEEEIASVKIFLHYDSSNSFLKDDQILKDIKKIEQIPTIIVHGRYDLLCTFDQAWALHNNLKNSEIVVLPNSNHKFTADGEIAKNMAFKYFLSTQS